MKKNHVIIALVLSLAALTAVGASVIRLQGESIVIDDTSLPASGVTGETRFDTTTSTLKRWNGNEWADLGTDFDEIATPVTPGSGKMKLYPKSDGKFYQLDDTGLERQIGSGSGSGEINYIDNSGAEDPGTTGWVTYADAAGTLPVDGTGGSATVTLTRDTGANLIRDVASFKLTKDAANRQGEGASYDFSISDADSNKLLKAELEYRTDGTCTDTDFSIHVYDVTAAALVQGVSNNVLQAASGASKALVAWPSSGNNDYRLIVHVGSTNAAACDLYFDTVIVGPGTATLQSVVTDPVGFTPVFPNGNFTFTNNNSTWSRAGQNMIVKVSVTASSSGSVASALTMTIPNSQSADTASIETLASSATSAGHGSFYDSSSGNAHVLHPAVANATTIRINAHQGSTDRTLDDDEVNNLDKIHFTIRIPIAGWKGSAVTIQPSSDDLSLSPWKPVTGLDALFSTDTTWTVNFAESRRVGENYELNFQVDVNVAGAGTETIYFTLPDSLQVKTGVAQTVQLCDGFYQTVGSATHDISCQLDATGILFRPGPVLSSNRLRDNTVTAGDSLSVYFQVPIEGWSVGSVPAVGVENAGLNKIGLAGPANREGVIAGETCGSNCDSCAALDFNFGVVGPAMFFGFEVTLDATSSGTDTGCDIPIPSSAPTFSFVEASDVSGVCRTTSGTPANAATGLVRGDVGANQFFLRVSDPPSASALSYQCTGIAFQR